MVDPFIMLADLLVFNLLGLSHDTPWVEALHFFIEDVSKIYVLLALMIYVISVARAGLDTEKIRLFLQGKARWAGYLIAAVFGAITPFCSCSSIPLFLGFTAAKIPLGITMSFLITSPMINEAAVVILGASMGWQFTLLYVVTGLTAGIIGGWFMDVIKADRYLTPLGEKAKTLDFKPGDSINSGKITWKERHEFALSELSEIWRRVWIWVLGGVGLAAAIHGFVPEDFLVSLVGDKQWWSVPLAVLVGIPLYSNATGVIPVIESLMSKGLPVGTALAFMMSTVAASLPEFILLKQVMKPQLLGIFFVLLLVMFTLAGWIFNLIL